MSLCSGCSEEEISTMQLELDKYGINMPSFGKIGGILANQVCYVVSSHPAGLISFVVCSSACGGLSLG